MRVAILGLGMMGGSLALAMRDCDAIDHVTIYARRKETRDAARARNMGDRVVDNLADAVRDADLSIFCVPIKTIPTLVEQCLDDLKPGSTITDVGSTKLFLEQEISKLLTGTSVSFVGSHPVAGSEKTGVDASRADLYEGAAVVLTPGKACTPESVELVRRFWQTLGSFVVEVDHVQHDRILARTSHLPHLAAALVVSVVGRDEDDEAVASLCGTGFADTTRIANGDHAMWRDIVETNHGALLEELRITRGKLNELIAWLEQNDFESVESFLEKGRVLRRSLLKREAGKPEENTE